MRRANAAPGPIPFSVVQVSPSARRAAGRVLKSGWLTMGDEVGRFEGGLARFLNVRHAIAVSSCTAAIELALRALPLEANARVVVPTMTFCGVVQAIAHAGYQPILADVDADTAMMTEQHVAEARRRAGGIDALVVLHYAGFPASVEALADAARVPLTHVVEDAAHALGAWSARGPIGSGASTTCFSFYATKNLPVGEGGMVTTNDDEIADHVARARLHGMSRHAWQRYSLDASWRYSVDDDGLKANMTDLQAAIARAQLEQFPMWQARRERIAEHYTRRLQAVPGILLPPRPSIGRHAWHLFAIQADRAVGLDRDRLIASMRHVGIQCSVHYIPVHQHPYFRRTLDLTGSKFDGADHAAVQLCSLPMYPSLSRAQVDRVCDTLEALADEASSQPLPVAVGGR
jgi:dTDP-4-amino-4,6-dideoxygalactose transaminase